MKLNQIDRKTGSPIHNQNKANCLIKSINSIQFWWEKNVGKHFAVFFWSTTLSDFIGWTWKNSPQPPKQCNSLDNRSAMWFSYFVMCAWLFFSIAKYLRKKNITKESMKERRVETDMCYLRDIIMLVGAFFV